MLKKIKLLVAQKPFEGLSDEAKAHVQRNFVLILCAQLFNKLAGTMASAKIVLPWLMGSIGAPTFLTGLLVPIRESGSLIPQILIGGKIQALAYRKKVYVIGIVVQVLCIALIALCSVSFSGSDAGLLVVVLIALFSLVRGVCSLTSKDVLGKTIPKANRGRLMGISASISGLISIGLGLLLFLDVMRADGQYWLLLTLACLCWVITACLYAQIIETAGETEDQSSANDQIKDSLDLLKNDAVFRRFVLVRTLMMSSSLCAPYFVLLAQQSSREQSIQNLGMFIVVSGVASFMSSSIWGRFADQSSKRVLLVTSIFTAILCVVTAGISIAEVSNIAHWAMALYFLLSITHQGVRLGRKTYVVDMADGSQRTRYVATSNSVIGVLLLTTGLFGAIAAQFSIALVLAVFAAMAIGALVLGKTLPEAN